MSRFGFAELEKINGDLEWTEEDQRLLQIMRVRRWQRKNKDKVKAASLKFYYKNSEKLNSQTKERRRRKRKTDITEE